MSASRPNPSAAARRPSTSRDSKPGSIQLAHVLAAGQPRGQQVATKDKELPRVCSDLSSHAPVSSREMDAIETYLAPILDGLFDPLPRCPTGQKLV